MNQADFFAAIAAGNLADVSRLLDAAPALLEARNERGATAVLTACYTGRKEIRDLLIAKGAKLELHEAAAAGQLPRVAELVEASPAASASYSPDGFPVLALAAAFGHEQVVRYLVGKGAPVDAVASNGTGYTALTGAVAGGHAEIVKLLLGRGADANYRYAKGYSPLLTAAANGHFEIVKTLVAHGADRDARTDDGRNALALASERGHQEVAAYLRGQGVAP